ncbi:stress responsive a/B barrel domain-containing protein [Hirsutella rhossiliensis]
MADRIHRVTMFKAPKPEDRQKLIEQYKLLNQNNAKDGKPYILSLSVGDAQDDPRSQGFTLVCETEFASLDDMKYYDDECPAHQKLKAAAKDMTIDGVMTVYFRPKLTSRRDG